MEQIMKIIDAKIVEMFESLSFTIGQLFLHHTDDAMSMISYFCSGDVLFGNE